MADPTREQRAQLLKNQALFAQFSDRDIETLLARSQVRRYAAGDQMFAMGSPGDSMMAVLEGEVRITSPSADGREVVLNTICAGEVFGEIALLDGRERTGAATAASDCELLVLHRRDFLPFLRQNADLCIILLGVLCQRLRNTTEQVGDVAFVTLGSRMAKTLLRLASVSSGNTSGAALNITQRELGNMVGGSRERVNRQLKAWENDGLIKLATRMITIRDRSGLETIV